MYNSNRFFTNYALDGIKTKSKLYKFPSKFNFDQFKERPKRHFVLFYQFVEDMPAKQLAYKEEHQKLVKQYEQSGGILLGGSYFPNTGSCLIFQGNDETVPDSFIKKDPYYKHGLVKDYEIKELELLQKKRLDEVALYYKYR